MCFVKCTMLECKVDRLRFTKLRSSLLIRTRKNKTSFRLMVHSQFIDVPLIVYVYFLSTAYLAKGTDKIKCIHYCSQV